MTTTSWRNWSPQIVTDWSPYAEFFRPEEFVCRHSGLVQMDKEFMDVLMSVRRSYGKPMRITSGYRAPSHPVEMAKRGKSMGEHTMGRCADVAVEGFEAYHLLGHALANGILRIGVQQKAPGRFLHLGIGGPGLASPWIWSY